MDFLRTHRIILLCLAACLTELVLFRESLVPLLATMLILAILIIRTVSGELSLKAEKRFNILSVTLTLISITIVMTTFI